MKRQDLEKQVKFLKKLVANPNDEALHLEYADFLTQHGLDDEAFEHYNFSKPYEMSKRWLNDLEIELGLPRDYLLNLPEENRNIHEIFLGDNEDGRRVIFSRHDEILKHWGIIYKRDFSDHDIYSSCAC